MKKLTLKLNPFNKGEVLSRAQLKKVMGGDGSSPSDDYDDGIAGKSCYYMCFYTNNTQAPGKGGTCTSNSNCVQTDLSGCDDRYGIASGVSWKCDTISY